MLKKISKLPFKGTPEQEAQLKAVIDAHKHDKSYLMAVMQEAQNIYGYLPLEVQSMIADGMDVPLEKVYGVATFYAQFSLSPKGEYNISVCLGTACYVKGSGDIFNKFSERLGIGADECTEDEKYRLPGENVEGERYDEFHVNEEALQDLIVSLLYVPAKE